MTIKFYCSCGKHLKARDEMAARRSVCPRCGSPVGVPSLKPTHRGTVAAPLTPWERARRNRDRPPPQTELTTAPAPTPAPPAEDWRVRISLARRDRQARRAERSLETHWYECLNYPLRAWPLCLGLAFSMTAISIVVARVLPPLLAAATADPWAIRTLYVSGVLLLILILGVPCSFLDCVLKSASGGAASYIQVSGHPVSVYLRSGGRWLTCFLAGPVVFAAVGWRYWLYCGDLELVDGLILAELGVMAVACWIFVLLAFTDRGRLRDLNPVAAVDLAHRLGWQTTAVVFTAAFLLLAHGMVLLAGMEAVHHFSVGGCLALVGVWMSGIFWSTFFCRLLGLWCFQSRRVPVRS